MISAAKVPVGQRRAFGPGSQVAVTANGVLGGLRVTGPCWREKTSLKEFVVVVQPAADVPTDALQRYLRSVRPDQDGKVGVEGIPPAEYIVTAVEALEQGEQWNPDYRARLREAGRRFSIKEGETLQLDLELAAGL